MQEFYEGNEFTDRIRCRSREKEECLELVEKILKFSIIYKEGGAELLSYELKNIEDGYLRLALELLIEETNSQELQSILSRHILAGNYHGKEFLKKMIVLEGIVAVQYNIPNDMLLELLLSLFGEDYINENKPLNFQENLLKSVQLFTTFMNEIRKAEIPSVDTINTTPKEFKKILLCDTKSVQKIVREIDNIFIVRAIKNLSIGFKKLFYDNINERSARILFDIERDIEFTQEEELEARSRILFILNKLIQAGEVTLEGSDYGIFL